MMASFPSPYSLDLQAWLSKWGARGSGISSPGSLSDTQNLKALGWCQYTTGLEKMLTWGGEAFAQKGSFLIPQESWSCLGSQGSASRLLLDLCGLVRAKGCWWPEVPAAFPRGSQWICWKHVFSFGSCGPASPIPGGSSPEVKSP